MTEPKPKGWKAFDSLARKVIAVPKDDVDRAIAAKPKRKRRKKRK
jgi:hypothetical protein